jgi:hypothetical protein
LAIELAAARVNVLSIALILEKLHDRFHILAGGKRTAPSRQQTMSATIDWSFALLDEKERRVFERLSVFAGGCTLEIATAVCAYDGVAPEEMLEVLAALVDKSLVTAYTENTEHRFRLLEPFRQYALEKLASGEEMTGVARRHACAFASFAHAAYEQWDHGPSPSWLSQLEPDLSNFRAGLHWTIEESHDRCLGSIMVADLAPVFLRLTLLAEGIGWCERVLESGSLLPAAEEARLRYGLSLLYNNQGANESSIAEALAAVALYRDAGDVRGLACALSQVAQHHARMARYDDARIAADESLQLARESQDALLLATSLRRCSAAFTADGMDSVRARYAESVALFRKRGADEETARTLIWWGQSEAEAGDYNSAVERFLEARRLGGHDLSMHLAIDVAACYLSLGNREDAEPMAREALALAAQAHHPTHLPAAIAYIAASARDMEALEAARLIGYAEERLRVARWQSNAQDQTIIEKLKDVLRRELAQSTIAECLAEGARWSESEAVSRASSRPRAN